MFLGTEFLNGRLWPQLVISLDLMTGVLAHRVKQRACRVWSRSKTQVGWDDYKVTGRHAQFVIVDAE